MAFGDDTLLMCNGSVSLVIQVSRNSTAAQRHMYVGAMNRSCTKVPATPHSMFECMGGGGGWPACTGS